VSGFISVLSWNWAFWIGAIFAGATWPLFWFLPETYGPTVLKRRAQRLRKETGDESIVAPLELEKTNLNHIVTVVLSRPLRMICFEPLVLFTCLYLSYACKLSISPSRSSSKLDVLTINQMQYSTYTYNPILSSSLESTLSIAEKLD
jgi:MFS family permease